MSIFTRLKKDRRTAADFGAAILEADGILKASKEMLADLDRQRQDLLLNGSASEVRKVKTQIEDVQLELESAEAAREQLVRLRAAASEAEQDARLDGLVEEAQKCATVIHECCNGYEPHARAIVPLAHKRKQADRRLRQINRLLTEAGREAVPAPIAMAFDERLELPVAGAPRKAYWASGAPRGEGLDLIEG